MEKHKRPKQIQSTTVRMETGCGHLYVTVGKDNGKIIELFATLGKAGGCTMAQNEALARAISLGLKYGVPAKEYVNELENVKCPHSSWDNGIQIMSCADAIAKALKREIETETKGGKNE